MDQNLIFLRQRMIETSTEFLKAQRVYLEVSDPNVKKSETELKAAADEYLKAAKPYAAALQNLRQYLLTAEPTEAVVAELDRTQQFINTLQAEKIIALERVSLRIEEEDE